MEACIYPNQSLDYLAPVQQFLCQSTMARGLPLETASSYLEFNQVGDIKKCGANWQKLPEMRLCLEELEQSAMVTVWFPQGFCGVLRQLALAKSSRTGCWTNSPLAQDSQGSKGVQQLPTVRKTGYSLH